MRNKVKEFLELKSEITEELRSWVVDKDIPIDERWEVFTMSELGKHGNWYMQRDYLIFLQVLLRYETIPTFYLLDLAIDNLCYEEDVEDFEDLSDKGKLKIINYKEMVLKDFLYSLKNDW